jgi:hypothetical protein
MLEKNGKMEEDKFEKFKKVIDSEKSKPENKNEKKKNDCIIFI